MLVPHVLQLTWRYQIRSMQPAKGPLEPPHDDLLLAKMPACLSPPAFSNAMLPSANGEGLGVRGKPGKAFGNTGST